MLHLFEIILDELICYGQRSQKQKLDLFAWFLKKVLFFWVQGQQNKTLKTWIPPHVLWYLFSPRSSCGNNFGCWFPGILIRTVSAFGFIWTDVSEGFDSVFLIPGWSMVHTSSEAWLSAVYLLLVVGLGLRSLNTWHPCIVDLFGHEYPNVDIQFYHT